MDISNPLRSLAPTVDADVLAVLAHAHAPLTGLAVQRLAGRSYGQVNAVLRRLTEQGLVDGERVGNAVQYKLNRDHVLADEVVAGATAADRALERLAALVGTWVPGPVSVVVFGSFARRDGGPSSDVDLLLVRPDAVEEDDEHWGLQRAEMAQKMERWTGNSCQVVELSESELSQAATTEVPLVASLRADGHEVFGAAFKRLVGPRRRMRDLSRTRS